MPALGRYDPYYAEFVMRRATRQLAALITELLGTAPLTHGLYRDDPPTPGGMVRFYGPLNAPVAALDTPRLPVAMLSETMLCLLALFDQGEPGLAFSTLYELALAENDDAFDRSFRELMTLNDNVRWLGQELHRLYGEDRVPTQAELEGFAQGFTARTRQALGLPELDSATTVHFAPTAAPLDPNLN